MPVCDGNIGLENLIRRAKERLKKNTYIDMARHKVLNSAHSFSRYLEKNHKKAVVNAVKRTEEVALNSSFDDEMYYKICSLLESGKSIQNPILVLMDKDVFNNLDSEAKQFYLNRLTEKYRTLRTRYYKEHCVMWGGI